MESSNHPCSDCERLRIHFDRMVRRNQDILREYEAALVSRRTERIEIARAELHEVEALRREARLKLDAHQATHEIRALSATQ
jgi:hypothetical protein